MTIRTRLSLWYTGILTVSLLIIGGGTYRELAERQHRFNREEFSIWAFDETR